MARPNELTLRAAGTAAIATVAPARGGLVTHFELGGRPILFMDQATLDEPTQNVRGGIPVLFPSPGKLAGDAWAYGGRQGSLKQHGFARNLKWEVIQVSAAAATASSAQLDRGSGALPLWSVRCAAPMRHRPRELIGQPPCCTAAV